VIGDYVRRTLARLSVAEEEYKKIDGFSRRALGILAGAAVFGGLTNVVRADPCTSRCGEVCTGTTEMCIDSCGGAPCWEEENGSCCDYYCVEQPFLGVCCSEWEGEAN
jgi:hypothetical protein